MRRTAWSRLSSSGGSMAGTCGSTRFLSQQIGANVKSTAIVSSAKLPTRATVVLIHRTCQPSTALVDAYRRPLWRRHLSTTHHPAERAPPTYTLEDVGEEIHALAGSTPTLPAVASIIRRIQSLHDQGKDVRVLLDALTSILAKSGPCHPFVLSALIPLLGKHDRSHVALDLVTRMAADGHVPDLFVLTALIVALGRSGDVLKAQYFFDEVKRLGLNHNQHSYNAIILAYARAGSISHVYKFMQQMRSEGIKPEVRTYTEIINYSVKAGMVEEAYKTFQEMQQDGVKPDMKTYSALITGFSQVGDVEKVNQLQEEMEALGLEGSSITYRGMVSGFARSGKLSEMHKIIENMKKRNMNPNALFVEQVINSLTDHMTIDQVFAIADSLAKKELEANPEVWHALLRICANAGDVKSSIRVLDIMRKHASSLVSTKSYVTIIDSLAKSSHISKSGEVIADMRKHNIKPDTQLYNAFMDGVSRKLGYDKTLQVFELMKADGVLPSHITFTILIDTAGHAGRPDEATAHFKEMSRAPWLLPPNINNYNSLIEALARNNRFFEAEQLIDRLLNAPEGSPVLPTAKTISSLLSFLVGKKEYGRARKLAEKMHQARVTPDAIIQQQLEELKQKTGYQLPDPQLQQHHHQQLPRNPQGARQQQKPNKTRQWTQPRTDERTHSRHHQPRNGEGRRGSQSPTSRSQAGHVQNVSALKDST